MHKPYREIAKREPDFLVRYCFFRPGESGLQQLPVQGIRCDFWYPHPFHEPDSLFMIRPEFLDEHGQTILDNKTPVPECGLAEMWILDKGSIPYHREKIGVGTTGYFMEFPHKIAECKVLNTMGELARGVDSSFKESINKDS